AGPEPAPEDKDKLVIENSTDQILTRDKDGNYIIIEAAFLRDENLDPVLNEQGEQMLKDKDGRLFSINEEGRALYEDGGYPLDVNQISAHDKDGNPVIIEASVPIDENHALVYNEQGYLVLEDKDGRPFYIDGEDRAIYEDGGYPWSGEGGSQTDAWQPPSPLPEGASDDTWDFDDILEEELSNPAFDEPYFSDEGSGASDSAGDPASDTIIWDDTGFVDNSGVWDADQGYEFVDDVGGADYTDVGYTNIDYGTDYTDVGYTNIDYGTDYTDVGYTDTSYDFDYTDVGYTDTSYDFGYTDVGYTDTSYDFGYTDVGYTDTSYDFGYTDVGYTDTGFGGGWW
ncbi:MAG: hypothetical protein LBF61_08410, partial [Azoarcus sp.]|nr:hypothetical protein [Azoarcus sp.]